MVLQRTVLRVNFSCDKDRKKLLQAVSGIRGVDRVEIDVNKETLTVTGHADPYEIIMRTQKAGRFVEVMSVGPPFPPTGEINSNNNNNNNNNKKPDDKKPEQKPQPPPQAQPQAQPKAQPQPQPKAQPQAQPQAHGPQAQSQAQIQYHAQAPTQAHSHVHNPNPCPVCQHLYMYQLPVWMSPAPNWEMRGNYYF